MVTKMSFEAAPSEPASAVVSPAAAPTKRRGPGRPKGLAKTGGRKPGVRNRVTRDLKEAAQRYTRRALKELWKIATTPSYPVEVRLKALESVLDRGHGRPARLIELSGPGGAPIEYRSVDPEEVRSNVKKVFGDVAGDSNGGLTLVR